MKSFIVLVFAAIIYSANAKNLERRDLRDDLLQRAAEIEARATAEIKKLEADNRTALAAGLQREEKYVQDLAAELKTATGPETIRLLETELNLVEQRLDNELRALARGAMTKEELLAAADRLETYIAEEVKKLQAQGRNLVAAALNRESAILKELSSSLKSAVSETRIRVLEVELRLIETRVSEELRRLGFTTSSPSGTTGTTPTQPTTGQTRNPTGSTPTRPTERPTTQASTTIAGTTGKSIVKRDLRDDLLKRAAEIEARATAEIKKLEADNRTALAAGLQREEKYVQDLAAELKTATGPESIRLLETELNLVEQRLDNELRALARGAMTKEELLAAADRLETYIAEEVKKLQAQGRNLVAAALNRESAILKELSSSLKSAVSETRIRVLEVELRLIETRVSEELRRLGFTTSSPSGTTGSTPTRPTERPTPTAGTTLSGSSSSQPATATTPTRPATGSTQ